MYTPVTMKVPTLIPWLLLILTGCTYTTTRKYDISVRNETGHPITLWLTKDGPPVEAGWRTPEQVALATLSSDERIGGVVVPAGKTAYTGEVKGEFISTASAWLRIYDGQYKSISMLLAVSPRSRDRVDYALFPGKNQLVVKVVEGKLEVEEEPATMPVPRH